MTVVDAQPVAILGAGPIGCATAAYLAQTGRRVALWSPTGRRVQRQGGQVSVEVRGALSGVVRTDWLDSLAQVATYPVVLVCLPATQYQAVLTAMTPHWRSGQTVLISGALSLVTWWLDRQAAQRGVTLRVGGWNTTPTTAHFEADGVLHVNALRGRLGVCPVQPGDGEALLALCRDLLGDRFERDASLLHSTLSNINPIAHAAEVIPNLNRINRGEAWPLFGCFDEVVGRIAQGLDDERRAIGAALGLSLPSLVTHYHRSYHVPEGPLHEMAAAIDAAGFGPKGPAQLAHRYVLEDMPFGVAFQERLAQRLGVACPLHTSALTLLEAAYGHSLRDANYLLDAVLSDEDAWSSLVSRARAAA